MADQGNGRIELHNYQIKDILDKLRAIEDKLDAALTKIAVQEVQIRSLESWRVWATGIGTGVVLALLGVAFKVIAG